MRKISAIYPAEPPQPTGPLAVRCPICDATPGKDCEQPATSPFPDGGTGHGYRLVVAREVELNRSLQQSRQAALDELETILHRLKINDFTADEAIGLLAILRPAHERIARKHEWSRGTKPRLVGVVK